MHIASCGEKSGLTSSSSHAVTVASRAHHSELLVNDHLVEVVELLALDGASEELETVKMLARLRRGVRG